jgi:hypothetical protein
MEILGATIQRIAIEILGRSTDKHEAHRCDKEKDKGSFEVQHTESFGLLNDGRQGKK